MTHLHQRLLFGGCLERTYGKLDFRIHRRGNNEKGVYTRQMNEVFEKEIEHIAKRLETLEHTVYGNGHKGLKAELIELKTEIETFKKNRRLASGYPPRHPLRRSEDFDLTQSPDTGLLFLTFLRHRQSFNRSADKSI